MNARLQNPRRAAAASALLLSLWCVAVLSVTVLGVAGMVALDVDDASLRNRRFEARQLALTGVAYGLNPRIEIWDPLLAQDFADGRRLRVKVVSEAARLDINRMIRERQQRTLRKLFENWGVPLREIPAITDSLADWADPDELRSLNGAERADLERQAQYSLPANRDFRSVVEMEKVRGMDIVAAAKPDWAATFTVNGGRRIDLQEASLDVLRAAGGLSMEQARQVELARNGADREPRTKDDYKIKDVGGFLQRLGLSEPQREAMQARFGAGTGPVRIESRATVGGVDYVIVAVANRPGAGGGEVTMLDWEER